MMYISKHAASVEMVRRLLERRAKQRLRVQSLDQATIALIDAAIADLMAKGLLDDASFAKGRAVSLSRKGLSRTRIARGLRAKGLAGETIEEALGKDIDDLDQARRLVKRRRLGPLRPGGITVETRRKDLAALARAGFSFAIAARALDGSQEP